jgi:colicin import membrane protein
MITLMHNRPDTGHMETTMTKTRGIALAVAIVAAASTVAAPVAHARGGLALGIGLGLIGAIHAHNVAKERAEAAWARERARAAAYERARAIAAARAKREAELKAAAQKRAAAAEQAKQDTNATKVAAAPRTSQDDALAQAIESLKSKPGAKASPKSVETPPPAVAKVDATPADKSPTSKPATGDCKRFVPSAGTTISVPCTE